MNEAANEVANKVEIKIADTSALSGANAFIEASVERLLFVAVFGLSSETTAVRRKFIGLPRSAFALRRTRQTG